MHVVVILQISVYIIYTIFFQFTKFGKILNLTSYNNNSNNNIVYYNMMFLLYYKIHYLQINLGILNISFKKNISSSNFPYICHASIQFG